VLILLIVSACCGCGLGPAVRLISYACALDQQCSVLLLMSRGQQPVATFGTATPGPAPVSLVKQHRETRISVVYVGVPQHSFAAVDR
jgi:hypothetical protein